MLDESQGGEAGVEEFDVTRVLTQDEQAAIFRKHFGILSSIDDKITLLKQEAKNAKAQAKVRGIAIEDLNWALKTRGQETDTVVDTMRRRYQIAGWLNFMPQGYQPDLFKDDRSTIERAVAKGAIASTFNKRPDPQADGYAPESEEGQAWLRGFNEEQAESRKHLKSAEDKLRMVQTQELKEAAAAEADESDPTDAALPKTSGLAGRKVPKGTRKKKA